MTTPPNGKAPQGLESLSTLCGLRSAPALEPRQREALRVELDQRVRGCEWFTIGVMAPDQATGLQALRSVEKAFGWTPLAADALPPESGPVFLKGNQHSGTFRVRGEEGLGEGLLITGHSSTDPEAEGTWGPFPLDFFG